MAPSEAKSGTEKHSRFVSSSGSENHRMKGRNLPQRVIVRSTIRPAKMSANASQSLTNPTMPAAAAGVSPTASV